MMLLFFYFSWKISILLATLNFPYVTSSPLLPQINWWRKRQKASIEDQKKWAHEYLSTMQDYNIVAEYEEKQSAKAPWRPLFNDLMSKIYAGQVDTVIVWAVDRLSRNEIDEWAIKWAVRSGKLKQIITRDATYTENELFAMWIFLSMSAEEIATMRKRILRRMDNMVLKEGKVPFHAPYAYKI